MKPHMTTRQKFRRRRLNRILKRNMQKGLKGLPVKWEYGMLYMKSVAQDTLKQYEHLLD